MELDEAIAVARKGEPAALAQWLRGPGPANDREAYASALLRALDDGALKRLRVDGRAAEARAVEALLSCGEPWALQLTPEQLDLLRNEHARALPGWVPPVLAILSLLATLGMAWALFQFLDRLD